MVGWGFGGWKTNFTLVPRELGKGFTAEYVIAGGLVLLSASVPLLMDCVAERRTRIHSAIYDANQKSHLCEDQVPPCPPA